MDRDMLLDIRKELLEIVNKIDKQSEALAEIIRQINNMKGDD